MLSSPGYIPGGEGFFNVTMDINKSRIFERVIILGQK